MPLLAAEPSVFPPDLLKPEDPSAITDALPEFRWWVLHTRPRAEKALVRRLLKRPVPIGFFLPQRVRHWRTSGRQFSAHLLLFPGYVFLHGGEGERTTAMETNYVANCLPVRDQTQLRRDLHRVFRLISTDGSLTPEERLGPGDMVEITQGPLSGLQGRIIRRGKKLTFIVDVQFIQQGVSTEIDDWMLEPLHKCAAYKTSREMGTKRGPSASQRG